MSNSIKILYMTDVHFRGTNPRARTDNYLEAVKEKLIEVFNIAHEEGCQQIVCGGDLFDRPDTSFAVTREFVELIKRFPFDNRILTIPGNHEIYGYSLETLPRTVLGLLELGYLKILNRTPFTISNYDNDFAVSITGQGFYYDIDRNPNDYMVSITTSPFPLDEKTYHVHVIHSMLVDKPLPYDVPHTVVKNVKTNADVILSGHEHIGYGVIKREDGVIFCNPGALGRVSARVEEMLRPVQVAILTFTEEGITTELVPLKSARPGNEVLSREHIEQASAAKTRANEFLELLTAEGEMNAMNIPDMLNLICSREKIPDDVRNEALKRLGEKRPA